MVDGSFLGRTAVEWGAIAAVASVVVSIFNAVVVTAVAVFTFKYMQSTKELVGISGIQAEASSLQGKAALQSFEMMRAELNNEYSRQRAVFEHAMNNLIAALCRYESLLAQNSKPWHEPDCHLVPDEWETCRAFVSRKNAGSLNEMQNIEQSLDTLSNHVQGPLRAPDSQWIPMAKHRKQTAANLRGASERIKLFTELVLKEPTR